MRIHRPLSAGNVRPFLLFFVFMMVVLSLAPILSHGAVFWDDEMEQGNSGFSPEYMASTLIPDGTMAYDTNVKFSGRGSVRLNYPANCDTFVSAQQCGGSLTRKYPNGPLGYTSLYRRAYFRMSGQGPNVTPTGQFIVGETATKMLKGQSLIPPDSDYARFWWEMGVNRSKNFHISAENVPAQFRTRNIFSSITLQDNRWYCIETHEVMNTPGVANGVAEAWVDGIQVLSVSDVLWQRPGNDNKWTETSIFRQNGNGNVWWDRIAAGDQRIGCIGTPPPPSSDATPPAIPSGLSIR